VNAENSKLDSLCLYLYTRSLHPELFEIYEEEILTAGENYEARVWITGCSHVITIHGQDWSFCEVVDDKTSALPKQGLVKKLPFEREQSCNITLPGSASYAVNTQLETMSRRVYAEMQSELMALGNKKGGLVCFPQWRYHNLLPFTYMSIESGPSRLHAIAFHAFPDRSTITKVQSMFQIENR